MERKAIGFELKESYYAVAKNNCASALEYKNQLKIF
jgi:hypothetical protein